MERSRRGMEMTPRESSLARAAERPQKREGGNYRPRKECSLGWKETERGSVEFLDCTRTFLIYHRHVLPPHLYPKPTHPN